MSVNGRHKQCTLPDGNCGQNVLNNAISFESDTQNTHSHGVFRIMTKQNCVCNQPTMRFHRRETPRHNPYSLAAPLPPNQTQSGRRELLCRVEFSASVRAIFAAQNGRLCQRDSTRTASHSPKMTENELLLSNRPTDGAPLARNPSRGTCAGGHTDAPKHGKQTATSIRYRIQFHKDSRVRFQVRRR